MPHPLHTCCGSLKYAHAAARSEKAMVRPSLYQTPEPGASDSQKPTAHPSQQRGAGTYAIDLPACLPACLATWLPACLPACLPPCLPVSLPTHLPVNRPIWRPYLAYPKPHLDQRVVGEARGVVARARHLPARVGPAEGVDVDDAGAVMDRMREQRLVRQLDAHSLGPVHCRGGHRGWQQRARVEHGEGPRVNGEGQGPPRVDEAEVAEPLPARLQLPIIAEDRQGQRPRPQRGR
eukprot:scaffold76744_cov67-Phaeocystis_antarctica.AAC.10